MKQVVDKDERGRNVIFYRVPEESTQPSETRVGDIMQHLGLKPRNMDYCRLGRISASYQGHTVQLIDCFRGVAELKVVEIRRGLSANVYCLDRTVVQRKAEKGLVDQLKKLRTEQPSARYCIWSGEVVHCENSQT